MAASTTTVRVRYAETDRMGVVYYANYFIWFEVARTDLLRHLGWSYREMEGTGVMLPVDCGLMAGNIVMTREVIVEEI